MQNAFGDKTTSKTIIYRLYHKFKFGRACLGDAFHEGRLEAALTLENIEFIYNFKHII